MASTTLTLRKPLLADLADQSLVLRALVVLLGSAMITASSWIQVPMYPVPMTMQTYTVILIGALCGWRLAAETVGAFLAEAAVGLPVLAGGAGGLHHFWGPTGGYLIGFLAAATLIGWLVERGAARSLVRLVGALLAGEVVIFGLGLAWLTVLFGGATAISSGLLPFAFGDLVKTAFAAATVLAVAQLRPAQKK